MTGSDARNDVYPFVAVPSRCSFGVARTSSSFFFFPTATCFYGSAAFTAAWRPIVGLALECRSVFSLLCCCLRCSSSRSSPWPPPPACFNRALFCPMPACARPPAELNTLLITFECSARCCAKSGSAVLTPKSANPKPYSRLFASDCPSSNRGHSTLRLDKTPLDASGPPGWQNCRGLQLLLQRNKASASPSGAQLAAGTKETARTMGGEFHRRRLHNLREIGSSLAGPMPASYNGPYYNEINFRPHGGLYLGVKIGLRRRRIIAGSAYFRRHPRRLFLFRSIATRCTSRLPCLQRLQDVLWPSPSDPAWNRHGARKPELITGKT